MNDPGQVFVMGPLRQAAPMLSSDIQSAIVTYDAASPQQQTSWASAYDKALGTIMPSGGGAILLTTSTASSLVATGRTYTVDATKNNGTFGQFIPGVMPSQGIGIGDHPLQVLQLEESTNFRSNLGLVELSGNSATVHVTGYLPDSKITAAVDVPLGPNQFTQFTQVLASMFPGQNTYNGRISVQVTGGTGRVAAYGSVIDNISKDPTYVPFQ